MAPGRGPNYFNKKKKKHVLDQTSEAGPLGTASFLMPQELETHAFQLTVSVKGDLSPECQEELVKFIRKNTVMHYIVIEFGESNRRHMHALLVYKAPRVSRKIQTNVWERFVKPYHSDSLPRYAVKVQVCPGNDWYDEYLRKDGSREVLSDTWNREDACSYFPSQPVQEALMVTSKMSGVACPWLDKDILAWSASTFENTPEGALMFLKSRMFVEKNMVPIQDLRKRTEKAVMYWEYRNGVISPSERELFLLKQLQDGPAYDAPTVRGEPFSSARPSI